MKVERVSRYPEAYRTKGQSNQVHGEKNDHFSLEAVFRSISPSPISVSDIGHHDRNESRDK